MSEQLCRYCGKPLVEYGDQLNGAHLQCVREYVDECRKQQKKDDEMTGED